MKWELAGGRRTAVDKDMYLIMILINEVLISIFDRGQRRLNRQFQS